MNGHTANARLKLPSLPLTIAEQSPAQRETATSRLLPSDSSGHGAERRSVPDHVDAGGYSSTPGAAAMAALLLCLAIGSAGGGSLPEFDRPGLGAGWAVAPYSRSV